MVTNLSIRQNLADIFKLRIKQVLFSVNTNTPAKHMIIRFSRAMINLLNIMQMADLRKSHMIMVLGFSILIMITWKIIPRSHHQIKLLRLFTMMLFILSSIQMNTAQLQNLLMTNICVYLLKKVVLKQLHIVMILKVILYHI